jgi:hypothetical protein
VLLVALLGSLADLLAPTTVALSWKVGSLLPSENVGIVL